MLDFADIRWHHFRQPEAQHSDRIQTVSQMHLAEVDRRHAESAAYLVRHLTRYHDAVRLGVGLKPCSYIDAVPVNIVILNNNMRDVQTHRKAMRHSMGAFRSAKKMARCRS